jgi:putative Mg2+ transporter-C (MgtC) family protein
MRLPLGILTGVGFIGGGAILRRGSLVVGVTTAATLWYVTVVGLCFGGGQMLLGWLATAVGVLVLWGLRWVEGIMSFEQHALLAVTKWTARRRDPAPAGSRRNYGTGYQSEDRFRNTGAYF